MLRKIIDNLVYIGLAALFGGYVYYTINNQWDWKAQAAVYGGSALVLVYLGFHFPDLRAALQRRGGRYGSAALATTLLVVGILALISFLNFRHNRRLDLSSSQLYALSEQSLKVAKNLQNDVNIIGFFTDDPGAQRFQELMREYRYASSRFKTEVVDPQKDPGKVSQYGVNRNGQVVVVSGPKQESVDEATEEKITNALIKVTRKGVKTVYFLEGHGEKDINEAGAKGYSMAREAITKQNYQVKTCNLAQENKLPSDATVLIAAGPTVDFFPTEAALLKKYLADGGKLLILADPQNDFKMADFLKEYGLSLTGNVVIDASGLGQVMGLGAAAPLVADYADHAITNELKRIMTFYPFAQNVKMVSSSLGYQTSRLFSTTSYSWGETDLKGEAAAFNEGKDEKGPLDLAAVATHSVADAGKADGGDEKASRESRLALIGDSDFAANAYARSAKNLDVFLNTVSWLAEDTDLIAVRPKSPENRSVNMTLTESKLMFWATVVLLPLVTLVSGVSVWYRRR